MLSAQLLSQNIPRSVILYSIPRSLVPLTIYPHATTYKMRHGQDFYLCESKLFQYIYLHHRFLAVQVNALEVLLPTWVKPKDLLFFDSEKLVDYLCQDLKCKFGFTVQ